MTLTPWSRKLVLTLHVTTSVGWMGAVGAFLALALAGLTSRDLGMSRASYVAMELVGWSVIVPLSVASLLSGVVQSLGTPWGLFRHYWVLIKLIIAVLATILLLVHMQPVEHLSSAAADTTLFGDEFRGMRIQLIADAAAALAVLLVATTLSVYKPRGLTRYGRRKQREQRAGQFDGRVGQS